MASALRTPGATDRLLDRLGYRFEDPALLLQALTHPSYCSEHGGESNQRLEFLGDAVLGLVVAHQLYLDSPELREGELSKARAAVVRSEVLARAAGDLELGDALLLGRGEESSGGREKPSILEDALEAVIGAVYLDGGFVAARKLIVEHLGRHLGEAAIGGRHDDPKSRLQEHQAKLGAPPPRYEHEVEGPDHDRTFHARVLLGDREVGRGTGRSKKQAEQEAARSAWLTLVDGNGPQRGDDGA